MNGNRKRAKSEHHMHILDVEKSGTPLKNRTPTVSVDLEAIKMVISISFRLRRQTPIYMDVIIMILHRSRNKIDYCDSHEQFPALEYESVLSNERAAQS